MTIIPIDQNSIVFIVHTYVHTGDTVILSAYGDQSLPPIFMLPGVDTKEKQITYILRGKPKLLDA